MASQVPKQGALFVSYFFWNMFIHVYMLGTDVKSGPF